MHVRRKLQYDWHEAGRAGDSTSGICKRDHNVSKRMPTYYRISWWLACGLLAIAQSEAPADTFGLSLEVGRQHRPGAKGAKA